MIIRAVAVTAFALLAACSGGTTSVPTPQSPVQAPAASGPLVAGTARLTLEIPRKPSAARRAPQYVSPNSAFLVVTVSSVNGSAPTTTQVPAGTNPQSFLLSTAPGGNCVTSPTGETCTVTIAAPTGQVNYQFDLLDASKNKLATLTQVSTIAPGTTANVQAVLQGIVASVAIFTPTLNAGTSFSGPITVEAFDASGALIVGSASYANTFTLTDGDASGATSLTVNATTGLTVTVTSSNDVVILNFDGEAIDPFAISATIAGQAPGAGGSVTVATTSGPVSFPGTPNDTKAPSDPNYHQPTLAFTSIPQTMPFTAAEVGWSDHGTHGFTVALDPATCGSGAAAVVTVAPAPGTNNRTFNVTSHHAGLCKATLTGGPPAHPSTGVIWFSV